MSAVRWLRRRADRRVSPADLLPAARRQTLWITCVVDQCDREAQNEHPDYTAAHWTFTRKVLGFSREEAAQVPRLRSVRLTRELCEQIASDWLRCEVCGEPVTDEASRWCAAHLTTTEATA
jgi:hypothetical protein